MFFIIYCAFHCLQILKFSSAVASEQIFYEKRQIEEIGKRKQMKDKLTAYCAFKVN